MAISYDDITAGSNQTVYNFNFDYIETTDVKVKLNGTDTTAYTLSGDKQVTLNAAPTQNTVVRIYRDTNSTTLEKTFISGSTLKAEELNANFKQALFVTQETTRDVAESSAGNVVTQVTTAVNTANAASTTATNAENTANGIAATASSALSTANAANTTATAANTAVAGKANIGANVSTFANDANYISSTSGDITVDGNDIIIEHQDKLIFKRDGTTQMEFTTFNGHNNIDVPLVSGLKIRGFANADNALYVQSTGGTNTYLKVNSDESKFKGNVVPESGSTHNIGASNNTWSNIYADNLYGNGSNLTSLPAGQLTGSLPAGLASSIKRVKEVSNASEVSSSNSWTTALTITFDNVASTSRFLVVSGYSLKILTNSSRLAYAKMTSTGGNFLHNITNENATNTYQNHTEWDFDTASNTTNRTYELQIKASHSGSIYNAQIQNAFLIGIEFTPS